MKEKNIKKEDIKKEKKLEDHVEQIKNRIKDKDNKIIFDI